MKAFLNQNADFLTAIQNEPLVYLFGTGISAALTGKPYSWWQWILDGIHRMTDTVLASGYEAKLRSDASAENMIDIVGKVLSATKADGTYDTWMQESLEKNGITDPALARTLRKLLLTQDVFATTNYDLLLEQATGLGTLTYEEPDQAFSMLERRIATHVLHIHGAYDSANRIDNIVADQAQYDAVMRNQGAQFIQNILGTGTLVFVGCGKTTEDCNISRFIQFANAHLKMDKKYYFLHRTGESLPDMPDNIVCIHYGDEYRDLPLFLEDIAQERLRTQITKNVLIGRTAYQTVTTAPDRLLKYHYSQQAVPFSGRTGELQDLNDFVTNDSTFCWWAVTGQAGAGKSRLALEFLGRLPGTWFGFFLNDQASIKDVQNFVPFANTAVIIDYVSGRESMTARMLCELAQLFQNGAYQLRVLLLERENSRKAGSWYAKLIQRFGRFDRQKMKAAEYRSDRFLNLGDLQTEDVIRLIGSVCALHGLVPDQQRDAMLCDAYGQKFEKLQFRPLFVQIFVEAWIENGCSFPRYDSFEDLLAHILEREQERWLELLQGDQRCCNALVRLLIRANISGRLEIANIPELYRADWEQVNRFLETQSFPGQQREDHRQSLIHAICQDIDENAVMLAPLFPDIIKEYMFSFYMEKERLPQVVSELWRNAPQAFSEFITRCLSDFPDNPFYKQALQSIDPDLTDHEVLSGRLRLLEKRVIEERDDPAVLIDIIDNEYAFWKALPVPESGQGESDRLAVLKLAGLHMVARQYGGWSYYDISLMMEVILEMLEVPGGPATQALLQLCLHEHIRDLSVAGFQEEAKLLTERMNSLLEKDAEDDWNALQRMVNANVEMMHSILEDDFPKAMAVLKQMERRCKYEYVEAVKVLMHSCFNMTNLAFHAERPKYIDAALLIAEKTALLYPQDAEITSRLLGCRVQKLQYRYFYEKGFTKAELEKQLREVEEALNRISLEGASHADEAFSMTWGGARMLRMNIIKNDGIALQALIQEATSLLMKKPYLTDVATTMIHAVRALHKNVLNNKISAEEVQNAFGYVERNPDSETLREAFFEMLEESEEASNRQAYFTKRVIASARQDARYNPANSSGIPEIEAEEWLMRGYLEELAAGEPYRRKHTKTGANDPCPCGSGKKFKKCCRGKGKFD